MYIETSDILLIIYLVIIIAICIASIKLALAVDERDEKITALEDKIRHLKIRCKALQCDNKYYEKKLSKLNKRRYNYGGKKRNTFTRKDTNSY